MTLSSMVVSRDWQEVSVLECILGSLQMDVTVENEPQRALIRLSKSKIDALIVDCDLNGTSHLLRKVQGRANPAKTLPLVIMGGPRHLTLDETGALFAFEKPISVEEAVRTLSAARNLIVDGRLRYHRGGLEIPVSLKCKGQKVKDAELVNLSQNGMQIHTDARLNAATALQISFALPGTKSGLEVQAEIVWQDQRGNIGVRFLKVAQPQQRTLQLWLAQQFLAN
jgi:DNA-binding response OmpR family regulator